MKFEWDENKNSLNFKNRQVDFNDVLCLWDNLPVERIDSRKDYGEQRVQAKGEINGRLYVVIYTWRGENRRIISARKANKRQQKKFRQELVGAPQTED